MISYWVGSQFQKNQISRPSTLHEFQIAFGVGGSMRGKKPGEHPGTFEQPSLGEAPVAVPGAVGCWETSR